jgi:hypothetical protein
MDWLFNPSKNEKSLAINAQKIVADMHQHLDKEKQRNRDLEAVIFRFQALCTQSLEGEIERLEKRMVELTVERDSVESSLKEKRLILNNLRTDIHSILATKEEPPQNGLISDFSTKKGQDGGEGGSVIVGGGGGCTLGDHTNIRSNFINEHDAMNLEETYMEEIELLESCRTIDNNLLFILHRSDLQEEAVAYVPSSDSANYVDCFKVKNCTVQPTKDAVDMPDIEAFELYGPRVVTSHDRDSNISEISIPFHILDELTGNSKKYNNRDDACNNSVTKSNKQLSPFSSELIQSRIAAFNAAGNFGGGGDSRNVRSNSANSNGNGSEIFISQNQNLVYSTPPGKVDSKNSKNIPRNTNYTGKLACAIEIPWLRDIIIDIWSFNGDYMGYHKHRRSELCTTGADSHSYKCRLWLR